MASGCGLPHIYIYHNMHSTRFKYFKTLQDKCGLCATDCMRPVASLVLVIARHVSKDCQKA